MFYLNLTKALPNDPTYPEHQRIIRNRERSIPKSIETEFSTSEESGTEHSSNSGESTKTELSISEKSATEHSFNSDKLSLEDLIKQESELPRSKQLFFTVCVKSMIEESYQFLNIAYELYDLIEDDSKILPCEKLAQSLINFLEYINISFSQKEELGNYLNSVLAGSNKMERKSLTTAISQVSYDLRTHFNFQKSNKFYKLEKIQELHDYQNSNSDRFNGSFFKRFNKNPDNYIEKIKKQKKNKQASDAHNLIKLCKLYQLALQQESDIKENTTNRHLTF